MRSILVSIKPQYVADILNHRKTIEIRKSVPKCELPVTVYIYCTKGDSLHRNKAGWWFVHDHPTTFITQDESTTIREQKPFNGKVVGKFILRFVEKIYSYGDGELDTELGSSLGELSYESCVPEKDLLSYVGDGAFYWAISALEIFDEPKELSEFKYEKKKVRLTEKYHWKTERLGLVPVKKAPRSWQFIEEEKE